MKIEIDMDESYASILHKLGLDVRSKIQDIVNDYINLIKDEIISVV